MLLKTILLASSGAAILAATSGAALAQQASSDSAAAASDQGLSEVVVTAQRRTENLQNVPISVTSFSGGQLASDQITSTLDLSSQVPSLFASNNVGQGSANVYYIRGLGQTQSFPTFQPQVGTYIDDIYISRVNANNFALFGVQQLQVLNGPQGTLFGSNSTGGAILVTLSKPAKTFGGDAEVSYGSYDEFTGRASVSMPVSDQILTETSVFGITNNGYVKDVTTGQSLNAAHNFGLREAVTLLPKAYSNVEWNLSIDYERNDNANLLNQPSHDGGEDGSGRIAYTGFTTQGGALEGLLPGDKGHYGQGAIVQTGGVTSNVKVDLGDATLNVITGFRGLDQALAADFPAVSLGPLSTADAIPTGEITLGQSLRNWQVSQELKLTGSLGQDVKYTTGLFYLYESNSTNYGQVLGLAPGLAFPLNAQFFKNQRISEAAYAQVDYNFLPKWTLTVGGRLTQEIDTVNAAPDAPGLGYTTAQIIAAGYSTHLDTNVFTPRVALQYQIEPQVMLFASATRGFQGGGWNGLTGANAEDFNAFKPEFVWSYETGFRAETPDRRIRFNATAYYENITSDQLLYDNPHTASFDTSNAADFDAFGLEGTLDWRPIDHLTLTTNFSAMDATYFKQSALIQAQQASCIAGVVTSCDSGIVTPTGKLAKPVYTPPLSLTQDASYKFDFNSFTLTPTASIQFVAREWFDTANTPGSSSSYPTPAGGLDKARTLINLGVTYAPKDLPITVTAECRNCTMVDYGVADLLGYDYFNAPGTWDIRLGYKF